MRRSRELSLFLLGGKFVRQSSSSFMAYRSKRERGETDVLLTHPLEIAANLVSDWDYDLPKPGPGYG
jgi:hypothetical protein